MIKEIKTAGDKLNIDTRNVNTKEIIKKFLCMYIYTEIPRHDEVEIDKESCYMALLDNGTVVHTEKIIPGQIVKHSVHIDYMIVEAKDIEDAKEKLKNGCNFQIICCICEDFDIILRLFRKGTKTIT